jgi:hypothetical protein
MSTDDIAVLEKLQEKADTNGNDTFLMSSGRDHN